MMGMGGGMMGMGGGMMGLGGGGMGSYYGGGGGMGGWGSYYGGGMTGIGGSGTGGGKLHYIVAENRIRLKDSISHVMHEIHPNVTVHVFLIPHTFKIFVNINS